MGQAEVAMVGGCEYVTVRYNVVLGATVTSPREREREKERGREGGREWK